MAVSKMLYHKMCKKRYSVLGFVRINNTYCRIINDVFQSFTIKCLSGGIYTVEFGIFPLCMAIPYCELGTYSLEKFDIEVYASNGGWKYRGCTKADETAFWENILNIIDTSLIPLFQKADSCHAARHALIKLDELFEKNRQEVLRRNGMQDHAAHWQELSIHAPEKYYMALKTGDDQYALRYLDARIDACREIIEGKNSAFQPKIVKERHAKILDDFLLHEEMLHQGNRSFFEEMIYKNEAISRANLYKESKGRLG